MILFVPVEVLEKKPSGIEVKKKEKDPLPSSRKLGRYSSFPLKCRRKNPLVLKSRSKRKILFLPVEQLKRKSSSFLLENKGKYPLVLKLKPVKKKEKDPLPSSQKQTEILSVPVETCQLKLQRKSPLVVLKSVTRKEPHWSLQVREKTLWQSLIVKKSSVLSQRERKDNLPVEDGGRKMCC